MLFNLVAAFWLAVVAVADSQLQSATTFTLFPIADETDVMTNNVTVGLPFITNTANTTTLPAQFSVVSSTVVLPVTITTLTPSGTITVSSTLEIATVSQVNPTNKITVSTTPTVTSSTLLFSTSPSTTSTLPATFTTVSTTKANPVTTTSPVSSFQPTTVNSATLVSSKIVTVTTDLVNDPVSVVSIPVTSTLSAVFSNVTTVLAPTSSPISGSFANSSSLITSSSISSGSTTGSTSTDSTTTLTPSSGLVSSSSTLVSSASSSTDSTTTLTTSSLISSATTVTTFSLSTVSVQTSATAQPANPPVKVVNDIFQVIDTTAPLDVFPRRDNPYPMPAGINQDTKSNPIGTNKFYTNMVSGDQSSPVYLYPFTVWKATQFPVNGLAISHTTAAQRNHDRPGPDNSFGVFGNPMWQGYMVLSAVNFNNNNNYQFSVSDVTSTSILCTMGIDNTNYLESPLVQGLGLVTGVYHGDLVPQLFTVFNFNQLTLETNTAGGPVQKYRASLGNGVQWLIYVSNAPENFQLSVTDLRTIQGNVAVDGLVIQVTPAPTDSSMDGPLDSAAGMYPVTMGIVGSTVGDQASFEFQYATAGKSVSGTTFLYALPHHLPMIDQTAMTGITLDSTTKGVMTGFLTNTFKFSTVLNNNIQWLPWTQQLTGDLKYSPDQLQKIAQSLNLDMSSNLVDDLATQNTYYSGKILDKWAYMLLTAHSILQDDDVTAALLQQMKDAMAIYTANKQFFPLFYDTLWGGIVSSADVNHFTDGFDFGNTYYNDHHFHYGYIIHAAAVLGYVDQQTGGTWAQDNKDWVNSLIRDAANPSAEDTFFPVSRMFDWFNGHSWAGGIFVNPNGKNEESSSEDYNFSYATQMWGTVIGDDSMVARSQIQLQIMKQSMNAYFYYSDDNTVEPSYFTPNRVSGILFDNYIDHATYFGTNPIYIHGIHMLPVTPAMSEMRGPEFTEQEWNEGFESISSLIANETPSSNDGGWVGIVRLNQALFDPKSSWEFFSQDNFNMGYLDNGMSLTWSLAFSGGIANSIGAL